MRTAAIPECECPHLDLGNGLRFFPSSSNMHRFRPISLPKMTRSFFAAWPASDILISTLRMPRTKGSFKNRPACRQPVSAFTLGPAQLVALPLARTFPVGEGR